MAEKRISNSSWKRRLSERLQRLVLKRDARVAIVGVGADLNGDDAVGLLTARQLLRRVGQREGLLVLEGGALPESVSGALRGYHPDLVIFIDAADLDKAAGSIEVLEAECIGGASFSTHGMPLIMMMNYLRAELGCETMLIGVQPEGVDFGTPPSQYARKAATRLSAALSRALAILVRDSG